VLNDDKKLVILRESIQYRARKRPQQPAVASANGTRPFAV
jgi:hypothetical protein